MPAKMHTGAMRTSEICLQACTQKVCMQVADMQKCNSAGKANQSCRTHGVLSFSNQTALSRWQRLSGVTQAPRGRQGSAKCTRQRGVASRRRESGVGIKYGPANGPHEKEHVSIQRGMRQAGKMGAVEAGGGASTTAAALGRLWREPSSRWSCPQMPGARTGAPVHRRTPAEMRAASLAP